MCAAAEFTAEVSNTDHTDDVAVLFPKQCHCAEFFCFFNRHFPHIDRRCGKDDRIDQVLDLVQLRLRKCLKMRKVEAHFLFINKLAGLFDMVA